VVKAVLEAQVDSSARLERSAVGALAPSVVVEEAVKTEYFVKPVPRGQKMEEKVAEQWGDTEMQRVGLVVAD